MGKNLIQQRRGKGSPTYRAPSFRYAGEVSLPKIREAATGYVENIIKSQGHSAPLMIVAYPEELCLMIAPEGIRVGEEISIGPSEKITSGCVMKLDDIPEGTSIFNIEAKPGDGGKYVRTSGTAAKLVSKTNDKIIVKMPSKKQKQFLPTCYAMVGQIAGSGRTEKPLLKAGKKFYKMKAKNKLWPSVSGTSMNAVDHPFGSKGSHTKGRPTQSPRSAPPGRKVGKIAPRRTGRTSR